MRSATISGRPIVLALTARAGISIRQPALAWLLHYLPAWISLGVCAVWAYVPLSTCHNTASARRRLRSAPRREAAGVDSVLVGGCAGSNCEKRRIVSFDRMRIATVYSHVYIITRADQDGFLLAVPMRSPHLPRKRSALTAAANAP